jgi:Icc protein
MRFIQITDTHIGATPDYVLRNVNTLRTLDKLVDHLNSLTFEVDFVIHTGDIADDFSAEAYRLARPILERLKHPIHYVVGNHDHADYMQRELLGRTEIKSRWDYEFEVGGVLFAVFDSRSQRDPNGRLLPEQIQRLRALCTPTGQPLFLVLHHQAIPLDVPWLDNGSATWEAGRIMKIENSAEFLDAIAPARHRIRGVMFGHVHRAFQVIHDGILFFSSASAAMQLQSWADSAQPQISDEEAAYNVVTLTESGIIVRQHYFTPVLDQRPFSATEHRR